MKYLNEIEKLLYLCILSQKIGERPVNVFLVADSESGGSKMMKQFSSIDGVHFTTDITYQQLVNDILHEAERDVIKTLMISDYNKIVGRPRSTKDNFEGVILSLVEEGIKNVDMPNARIRFKQFVRLNLITKVTTRVFGEYMIDWLDKGYLQRFLVVRWKYTPEQIIDIKRIDSLENISYLVPDVKELKLDDELLVGNDEVIKLSEDLAYYSYGFRLHEQLKSLIRANAIYRYINEETKSIKVLQKDIDEIRRLSKYMGKEERIAQDTESKLERFKIKEKEKKENVE